MRRCPSLEKSPPADRGRAAPPHAVSSRRGGDTSVLHRVGEPAPSPATSDRASPRRSAAGPTFGTRGVAPTTKTDAMPGSFGSGGGPCCLRNSARPIEESFGRPLPRSRSPAFFQSAATTMAVVTITAQFGTSRLDLLCGSSRDDLMLQRIARPIAAAAFIRRTDMASSRPCPVEVTGRREARRAPG